MSNSWQDDLVLGTLAALPHPIGSLVQAFPGRSGADENPRWIDEWFRGLVGAVADGKEESFATPISSAADGADLSPLRRPPVSKQVRLVRLRPIFFRGYRASQGDINLDSHLTVVEGRNSSGKTGVSEALEWLLTGALSRRMLGQHGSARELANCISNGFRPAGEKTAVEAVFSVDGLARVLRRVLVKDYDVTASSGAESELYVDGQRLTAAQARTQLDELFAGVHPILMQHTLRQFVHDDPTTRREYFERLLQIDQLTALIERSVVGDARLRDFPPPSGELVLGHWDSMAKQLTDPTLQSKARGIPTLQANVRGIGLRDALVSIGKTLVSSDGHSVDLTGLQAAVARSLEQQRESSLPLLSAIRTGSVAHTLSATVGTLEGALAKVRSARGDLDTASAQASSVTAANVDVARAYDALVHAGAIDPRALGSQICPICAVEPPTLHPQRLEAVSRWLPALAVLDAARRQHSAAVEAARSSLAMLRVQLKQILPAIGTGGLPESASVDQADVRTEANRALQLTKELLSARERAGSIAERLEHVLISLPSDASVDVTMVQSVDELLLVGALIEEQIPKQVSAVDALEAVVGGYAREDPRYRLGEVWLAVSDDLAGLLRAWQWQAAARRAQEILVSVRNSLIELRKEIVKTAQQAFSADMSDIWNVLRKDTPARFTSLTIPEPRGRGFKLELELKATIEGEGQVVEVDALRVFSESQINALGLAAYITRARRLGHRLLVFDDPVQSMDDEHVRSLATELLDHLLTEDFQILVLTHNDLFQRAIANHHYARDGYVTLTTRSSKRQGCRVEEGNRRVAERLKAAERSAEEGHLPDAWRSVRLAVERLYLLIKASNDPSFDPEKWRDQTAEAMWKAGVGEIVAKKAPKEAAELKDILDLSAAGAHDKAASGETDIRRAAGGLRKLLTVFNLGG